MPTKADHSRTHRVILHSRRLACPALGRVAQRKSYRNAAMARQRVSCILRFMDKRLGLVALTVSLASPVFSATITGNVKGPDGKSFMGAFVVAENTQNKMTVSVLSDVQGRYHIDNLPAATYSVEITAIGYKSDPRTGVRLTGDQKASFDFSLQPGTVRWSD